MAGTAPRCPVCGPSKFRSLFQKKGKHFYRCQSCRLELQWPLPTAEELAVFYDESFDNGMYQDFAAARELKQQTANQRLKEISKHVPLTGRWLDVGCANGVFVETVGKHVDAEGVEISQNAVMDGRERGLNLTIGSIEEFPTDKQFDCVTAFDVLEHVTDPSEFIKSIHARLAENGSIVLTVPNCGGIVRKIMGKYWYFYIPEEHLHYFNSQNLTEFLQKNGFDVVNVGATYKPMTFSYALVQFKEFNPLIYRILNLISALIPKSFKKKPIPLPIGELRIVARRLPVSVDNAGSAATPLKAQGSLRE